MCTVTYIPDKHGDFVFTSSRDESPLRNTIPPKIYEEQGVSLLYPKDIVAGGSWVLLSENKRLVCLMNAKDDDVAKSYAKSRGVFVKNIALSSDVFEDLKDINFSDFAPFTCVVLDWTNANFSLEIIWDGKLLQCQELNNRPRIWSSSSLYSDAVQKDRQTWFKSWLSTQETLTELNPLSFHNNSTVGTPTTAIRMKRSHVETVSITTIAKKGDVISMSYSDLLTSKQTKVSFDTVLDAINI
ncbi:MAG: NRDE family protein [Flavicella sp.]